MCCREQRTRRDRADAREQDCFPAPEIVQHRSDAVSPLLRLTITAAIDLINDHAVAHTEDLLKVARIGQMLFSQAVYTADEQDNTEFFVKAFEEWPDEVTELMEKMQLSFGVEERDQSTGERTGRSKWDEHFQDPRQR